MHELDNSASKPHLLCSSAPASLAPTSPLISYFSERRPMSLFSLHCMADSYVTGNLDVLYSKCFAIVCSAEVSMHGRLEVTASGKRLT